MSPRRLLEARPAPPTRLGGALSIAKGEPQPSSSRFQSSISLSLLVLCGVFLKVDPLRFLQGVAGSTLAANDPAELLRRL